MHTYRLMRRAEDEDKFFLGDDGGRELAVESHLLGAMTRLALRVGDPLRVVGELATDPLAGGWAVRASTVTPLGDFDAKAFDAALLARRALVRETLGAGVPGTGPERFLEPRRGDERAPR